MRIPLLAFVMCVSFAVSAQTPPPEPAKPAPPKADAKKDIAKKDEAKKSAAKKPPPKPAAAKKPEPAKKPTPPKKPIEIKTLNTDKPLVLRDKDGNVIPTSPDAYNVDSALPPKKR